MTDNSATRSTSPSAIRDSHYSAAIIVLTLLTLFVAGGVAILFAVQQLGDSSFRTLPLTASSQYPRGVSDFAEPSGLAPPAANSMPNYVRTYVNDFKGTALSSDWNVFTGVPAGDPGGRFASSHVVVKNGLLELNTWKDPKYQDRWVTGGLCQCGLAKIYGAYFVRSRITSGGPNAVELLWPASNLWPPEIDFNETQGSSVETTSTIHYGPINLVDQGSVTINMTKWHTWGLIWTAKSVTYIVDGTVWGRVLQPEESPKVPMTLDFEQRSLCSVHLQCPTKNTSMLIDWVAEFSPNRG